MNSPLASDEKLPSFFIGSLSIPYLLCRANKILGRSIYLKQALEYLKKIDFQQKNEEIDYLGGTAGSIISLLYLHEASKNEWVLPIIDQQVGKLLQAIEVSTTGIFADKQSSYIKGLCGLGHGASGIAATFLELGAYFNNPTFYWIAQRAIDYESAALEKHRHYPDYRARYLDKLDFLRKNLDEENDLPLIQKSAMIAWCHGESGIGLVRLRAWELLQKSVYLGSANTV